MLAVFVDVGVRAECTRHTQPLISSMGRKAKVIFNQNKLRCFDDIWTQYIQHVYEKVQQRPYLNIQIQKCNISPQSYTSTTRFSTHHLGKEAEKRTGSS